MSVVKLHILHAGGRLKPYESIIKGAFESVMIKLQEAFLLHDIDIVVADNPDGAIPETGVGGTAHTAHFVSISIHPDFPSLAEVLSDELKSTLAHELHHCVRMNNMRAYESLLDACVTEGLADHFDREINHTAPKPWSIAVQGKELQLLRERAQEEFDNRSYDYFGWFFGSPTAALPRWGGYSIGFELVGRYMEKTGKKASELVSTPAVKFIRELSS